MTPVQWDGDYPDCEEGQEHSNAVLNDHEFTSGMTEDVKEPTDKIKTTSVYQKYNLNFRTLVVEQECWYQSNQFDIMFIPPDN